MRAAAVAILVAAVLTAPLAAQQAVAGDALLDAARRGELAAVRELIHVGADVDAARGDGMTALHFAAERGHDEVARALIEARTRAGFTQAQLAARMKTTQSAVARMESGCTPPSTRTLEKVARATGSRLRIRKSAGWDAYVSPEAC